MEVRDCCYSLYLSLSMICKCIWGTSFEFPWFGWHISLFHLPFNISFILLLGWDDLFIYTWYYNNGDACIHSIVLFIILLFPIPQWSHVRELLQKHVVKTIKFFKTANCVNAENVFCHKNKIVKTWFLMQLKCDITHYNNNILSCTLIRT